MRRAAEIKADCEGPLGAVSVLDRPSWFTAVPRSSKPVAAGFAIPCQLESKLSLDRRIWTPTPSALT